VETKPRYIRFLLTGLLVLLLLALAMPAGAQDPTRAVSDDDVNAIAKDLYCPICESTPLDVCATQACADWREVIRGKLAEGQTEEEIKAYFELQYGARALAEPPRSGFTLAVWILPVVAIVIGGFVFGLYVRRMRTSPSGEASLAAGDVPGSELRAEPEMPVKDEPEPGDYQARIERELREM